jgi:Sulfite exporter TauE/SafE
MIEAVGSSLLAVGSFGLATAMNYSLSGLVDWPVAVEFIAGGVVCGLLGMTLAKRLSARKTTLNRIFAVLSSPRRPTSSTAAGRCSWGDRRCRREGCDLKTGLNWGAKLAEEPTREAGDRSAAERTHPQGSLMVVVAALPGAGGF